MHPDQRTGHPQLKLWVSTHPDKRPGCLAARPKVPQWACTPISGLGPTPKTPAGCLHLKPRVVRNRISGWLPQCTDQKRGMGSQPRPSQAHHWPGCLQATTPKSTGSEKLLLGPCAQNPAGPTGSLGGRQNTQQRGAAGLGEIAFPGKTRPNQGLNYPIAARRAPSI